MADMPSSLKRKLPEPAMLAVRQFSELVPGITCSGLVLGDLIEVLKSQGSRIFSDPHQVLEYPVLHLARKQRKIEKEGEDEVVATFGIRGNARVLIPRLAADFTYHQEGYATDARRIPQERGEPTPPVRTPLLAKFSAY